MTCFCAVVSVRLTVNDLPAQIGMYLGLSGATLNGEQLYWAGVTDYFAPASVLDTELLEHAGGLHSNPDSSLCFETDPTYLKNLALLREFRGEERLRYYTEELPEGLSKDDLEEYLTLKVSQELLCCVFVCARHCSMPCSNGIATSYAGVLFRMRTLTARMTQRMMKWVLNLIQSCSLTKRGICSMCARLMKLTVGITCPSLITCNGVWCDCCSTRCPACAEMW
jgi:hypothetical protein